MVSIAGRVACGSLDDILDTPRNQSNHEKLSAFLKSKLKLFVKLTGNHSAFFEVAKTIAERKVKFDEVLNQAVFDLVSRFVKLQIVAKSGSPEPKKRDGVIKQHVKTKVVKRSSEPEVKLITKNHIREFVACAAKFITKKELQDNALGDNAIEGILGKLPQLVDGDDVEANQAAWGPLV